MRANGQVVLLAVVLALAGCAKKKPPPPPPPTVVVAKPLQTQLVDWDDFVGRFEAINSVDIRPRVTGYLQSIAFRDGQIVKKGQLLFVIDPRPYQAALTQARGQEQHATAALNNAKVELVRAQNLLAAHAIPEQQYETRLATEQQAAADLTTAQGNVQTAALNVGFTRVTAPLSGRISDRRVAPGNLVTQDIDGPDQHHRSRPDPVHLRRRRVALSEIRARGSGGKAQAIAQLRQSGGDPASGRDRLRHQGADGFRRQRARSELRHHPRAGPGAEPAVYPHPRHVRAPAPAGVRAPIRGS